MRVHPVAALFPMLPPDELRALAKDIGAHGLREPIVVLDGMLLDGRNRETACKIAGVAPTFEQWERPEAEIVPWILSKNLHRRHLTTEQRAFVGAEIARLPAHRPEVGTRADFPTQAETAGLLSISERSIRNAKAVLDSGDEELIAKARAGEVGLRAAAESLRPGNAAQQAPSEPLPAAEVRIPEPAAAAPSRSRLPQPPHRRQPAPDPGPATSPPPGLAGADEGGRSPEAGDLEDLGAALDALDDERLRALLAGRRKRVRAVTRSERRENDAYYTPEELAGAIVRRLEPPPGFVDDPNDEDPGRRAAYLMHDHDVLEPSGGGGAFACPLSIIVDRLVVVDRDPAAPVFAKLRDRDGVPFEGAELHPGQDFLTWETDRRFDWIIGNPEYLGAEAHVRKALSLLKPGGRLVFLLRTGFSHGQERRAGLFREARLLEKLDVVPRPSFTGDGKTDGSDYAVFVWEGGEHARPHPTRHRWDGRFLDWTPERAGAAAELVDATGAQSGSNAEPEGSEVLGG